MQHTRGQRDERMALRVEFEYIEDPNEEERIRKVSDILAQGIYAHLKKKGLLRVDPKRKEKTQEAIDKAREITRRDLLVSEARSD